MLSMNSLQLELEIEKIATVMMTRNSLIGKDIITDLKTKFSLEAIAGLMIVSIERVIWFDIDSVFWTIEHLIPIEVMQEMKKLVTFTVFQQLVNKGFMPGEEFSVDASGRLLLNNKVKTAVVLSR